MIVALSQLGKQWSAKPQRFLTKCIYDLWLVCTHADTFKHSDTCHKHSSLLSPQSMASHGPLFAQDRPLGLAVAPLSMSAPVLGRRPHGPVRSGRAGQRSCSQNGPVLWYRVAVGQSEVVLCIFSMYSLPSQRVAVGLHDCGASMRLWQDGLTTLKSLS